MHFYINWNDTDSNFETMAEIFPDCESKKLQEFIENAGNVNTKKKDLYVANSSDDVGWRKTDPSGYYELRSQGNWCESEEVFISERMTTRTMSQTVWG